MSEKTIGKKPMGAMVADWYAILTAGEEKPVPPGRGFTTADAAQKLSEDRGTIVGTNAARRWVRRRLEEGKIKRIGRRVRGNAIEGVYELVKK